MKRIKDIVSLTNGVYGGIKTLYPTEYATMFGEIETSDLDIELLAKCGQRIISPTVYLLLDDMGEVSGTGIAKLVCNRYLKNWLRVNSALTADYDILQPIVTSYTNITNSTVETDETRDGSDTSKVYGMDSTTGENDTSRSTQNGLNSTVDTSRSTVYTKRGIGTLTPNRLINAEISLRKLSFIDLTLNDIKEFCTLSIY